MAGVLNGTAPCPGALPDRRVPTILTCGAIEENLANNRLMEQSLRARGYPAELA